MCSLKREYQLCRYVPCCKSDAGETAMTAIGTSEQFTPARRLVYLHAMTAVWEIMIRTIVCSHVRWAVPTLGCNQQDPRRASERPYIPLACLHSSLYMPGPRAANSAYPCKSFKNQIAAYCGIYRGAGHTAPRDIIYYRGINHITCTKTTYTVLLTER